MSVRSATLQKLLMRGRKGNPLTRLARLEQQSMGAFLREPSAVRLTDVTRDLGTMVQGTFIAPASISVSAEPTSTDFTGAFMSGDGYTFGGTTYNVGGADAGVLQWGAGTTDAKLYAGAGTVTLDADGLTLGGNSDSAVNSIKWVYGGDTYYKHVSYNNGIGLIYTYDKTGPIDNSDSWRTIFADSSATYSAKITLEAASGTVTNRITINADSDATTTNKTIINSAGEDFDTIIEGNSGTIATFDAGTLRTFLNGFLNFGAPVELTIDTGAVTATRTYHYIDTEGDAASDDLDTINGGSDGDLLILRSANAGRDPTLKDGTGNLYLAGDFLMSTTQDMITLLYRATLSGWVELSRSDNA